MKEEKPKLKEIKKEKLDDIYVDDKELINKNKKKIKQKRIRKTSRLILWITPKKKV
jgi:hypothetical protein